MKLKRVLASALLLATLLILPARAAQASGAKGEANITPDTPMAKIRSNPSVMGAGLYTYNQEQDTPRDIRKWKDTTLREYVNDCTAEDCAKGLNRMIENYNSGIQITYKLYTDEEIAAVPTRQKAEIYYFPGSDPGGKFVLVIGGNAIHTSAEMREGVSTAEWLNELGYTCFVLRYRIGDQAADNAPLEDVSRAVRYITEHAEQFHVQPEDYAVLAYSSGGQIAGLFASDSDTLGYKAYGVSKPGALLLGYPVNNFFELKPVWGLLIDPYADGPRYFDYNVSDYITQDYPPVYHWYGKNDVTLAKMYTPAQGRVIEKALVKNGVPHIFHHYHNAPHKIGPRRSRSGRARPLPKRRTQPRNSRQIFEKGRELCETKRMSCQPGAGRNAGAPGYGAGAHHPTDHHAGDPPEPRRSGVRPLYRHPHLGAGPGLVQEYPQQ